MKRFYLFALWFVLVNSNLLAIDLSSEDISEIQFDVVRSFDIYDPSSGYSHRIEAPSSNDNKSIKVRIVGQNSWAYKVMLEVDGVENPKEFLVTKKYLKSALDTATAYNALRLQQTISTAGEPPNAPCEGEEREGVNAGDFFQEPSTAVISNQEWKPGCEVLANRQSFSSGDDVTKSKLTRCIRSIQNSITRQGSVKNRGQVFRNMYRYLRPQEQHFAAMVFTSQGEAGILARDIQTEESSHPEEMMMIMKVIDNRVRNVIEDDARRGRITRTNALDIALDPWQFSMYNQGEDNWKQMMYPGRNQQFGSAIDAYMQFQTAEFEPDPEVNHVYHYHANWMLPSDSAWGDGFRANQDNWELNVQVNGDSLRQANPMYNENNSSDRRKIARHWKRQRHIFYKPIDTDGRITGGDDWHWTVRTPFRL
ncbi:hypothetical protein [Halobacteriovorax sp.]|uniref:hypothetical protein n=1 Tax=Halobacteriovorax sp. TaxID=2020862 RepID=UPI003AF2649D